MAVWAIKLHDKIVKQFAIDDGERLVIGRSSEADVVVDNTAISRKHTAFERKNGVYFLEDLGSLNGTMVNGKKIDSCVQLFDEDTIEIGKFRLLPAAEAVQASSPVSQSAAYDYGDETVFVTRTGGKAEQAAGQKGKGGHRLKVFVGDGSPSEVPLIGRSSVKIGKDANADLRITAWFVAGAQCYVINRDKKFYLAPQRSWAKTKVNGVAIKEEYQLREGDVIAIRGVRIRFE